MTLSDASAVMGAAVPLDPALLTRRDRAELLRYMTMMRTAEERALSLYKQGKIPGSFYDGRGQEAISVGAAFALSPRYRLCILHRDLGAHFVRAVTPDRYLANYMGRADGVTGGKDGNLRFGDRARGCVGMVSMLPDMALVANGMAPAMKMRGEPRVALTFFGDGSTANGQWHEAMNFAGVRRLPVVFVLENNRFAYSTPNELEFAADPVERAEGYGLPGVEVDATTSRPCSRPCTRRSSGRARAAARPWSSARRCACTATAPTTTWATCPPSCSPSGRRATRSRATRRASPTTSASPPRRSSGSRARSAPTSPSAPSGRSPRRCPTRRSPTRVTDGFAAEFGPERVLDTPLAENAIVGAATGAAIEGMRPVCEMQFADFIACGFDQLVNVAAKLHYRQGQSVPLVVRLPSGGGFSGGPFHSQNPEAWFLQAPGLKVVAPATAADAKGLLASAIRDPNPVCFLEHKGLYRHVRDEVPEGEYTVPLGAARVAREGGELTVIAYGSAAPLALTAAEQLEADIEVLDLRSLCPLDRDAILASARKTGKVLTAADVPIPFSPPLEQEILPQLDDMKEACRELLAY